ncbi:MAG: hypothetical protein LIO90_04605 [Bacteroidales bacterium]|nr:hypothetical protein [Bacteroidales bacterium]
MNTLHPLVFSRHIKACSFLLLLAWLLLMPFSLKAVNSWDGSSMSTELKGSGTEADPYQIWDGKDLYYLQQHPELWAYGYYYVQKNDIDLGSHPWKPIGYGNETNNSAIEACNHTANKPFGATYDGRGCKIEGLYVNWGLIDNEAHAFGLFGFVTGTLRNIHIDGAQITRNTSSLTTSSADIKVGVLVGAITPDVTNTQEVKIENIVITNSTINDGGTDPDYRSYLVGGVVGDITSGFGGWSSITILGRGMVYVRNIYCDVDIDLSNCKKRSKISASQYYQFNVGGIVGRIRRGKYSDIPASCLYTGQINATHATIAPVVGLVRSNSNNTALDVTKAYAGEVIKNENITSSTSVSYFILNGSEVVHEGTKETLYPDFERYYGNYSVYDSIAGTYATITDAYPLTAADGSRYGVRTLDESNQAALIWSTSTWNTAAAMRAFQGVAHGTYVNLNSGDGRATITNMLNANTPDATVVFAWDETGQGVEFAIDPVVKVERKTLHTVSAEILNMRSASTLVGHWTFDMADGTTKEIDYSYNEGMQTIDGYLFTASDGTITVTLPQDYSDYKRVTLTIYNAKGVELATDYVDISSVTLGMEYTIAIKDGVYDHYEFTPYALIDGNRFDVADALFDEIECQWSVLYGTDSGGNDQYIDLRGSVFEASHTWEETSSQVAHVVPSYMGIVKLVIVDNITGKTVQILNSNNELVDNIEQTIQQLHVDITMYEYNPSTKKYQEFKPSDYFSSKAGYDLSTANGTLTDTKVRPIVFKANIVDQFGNNWNTEDNASGWRIQWAYTIPGDGLSDDRKSPNYSDSEGYNIVNGAFDSTLSNCGIYQSTADVDISSWTGATKVDDVITLTDWVGAYYRDPNHSSSDVNFNTDRRGEFRVDSLGTRFMIHPNLLHRTSAFEVRARLYCIDSDPEGRFPTEDIINFNQLAVEFVKERDADGNICNYKANVVWRGATKSSDPTDTSHIYDSSSQCWYTWYSNPDPTNINGWTKVVKHDYDSSSRLRHDSLLHGDGTDTFEFDPTLYYKFDFLTSSGTHLVDIVGPKNVVYLYDRALTLANDDKHSFYPLNPFTNEYYSNGIDYNHGHDPANPVHSIERAYELLDSYDASNPTVGRRDNNCIVIMGYYKKDKFLYRQGQNDKCSDIYTNHTTITGASGAYISGGTWGWVDNGTSRTNIGLQAPLTLEHLDIYKEGTSTGYNGIYCYNHDFTVGEGVRMCHFTTINTDAGMAENVKAVNLTLVVGPINDQYDRSNPDHYISYEGNEVEGLTTIRLLSGAYGRIIGGSRYDQETAWDSKHVFGSPLAPNRVRMEINIPADDLEAYAPSVIDGNNVVSITHNIGMMVGGQTDGSVYEDAIFDMRSASISRFAAGNITWGRTLNAGAPDDSFFGSTELNVYGGTIDELYGGSLGRHKHTSGSTQAPKLEGYFYGRSIINLYGGTIGSEGSQVSLYAAGAGGVSGIGKDWGYDKADSYEKSYTPDACIPYFDSSNTLHYGSFEAIKAAGGTFPTMAIWDNAGQYNALANDSEEKVGYDLALDDTYVEINLYGGTILGDVYGGGLGYGNNLDYHRAPYRTLSDGTRMSLAGTFYGSSYIRLLPNNTGSDPVTVKGSIYGGGSGSLAYLNNSSTGLRTYTESGVTYTYDFNSIAQIFGDVKVDIQAGVIEGDVFAGGKGFEGFPEMANLYGNTSLTITGGEIYGHIYGGSSFSDILSYTDENDSKQGGNTEVTISDGYIGNCVFGGGHGSTTTAANVAGNATVNIYGGYFSNEPVDYIHAETYGQLKSFNIYGGGYINGAIGGNTKVNITASPLASEESLGLLGNETFKTLWDDITVRRFCVYGGGWGQKTLVKGNADVSINITHGLGTAEAREPQLDDIDALVPGQTFFDVAGGGYNGDVGYWDDAYEHYTGGNVSLMVKGAPFIRKVIGGAFYAQCDNTDTHVQSGTIKEVYGGALMGYVHTNGRLTIGRPAGEKTDAAEIAQSNAALFITENIYGGNDVKGIVGTAKWKDQTFADSDNEGLENTDQGPLYCADVSDAGNKGVTMTINGGTIGGNVYGAGNGHYRGYYVPGWARYQDGPDRQYRWVLLPGKNPGSKNDNDYGRVYRSKPMVGSVSLHIGGNSATDRVTIKGNVFGGGRSCTIGQWNTMLPFEDPRRLQKGGFMHVNFGSHVTVEGDVYMGSEGVEFAQSNVISPDCSFDVATYDGETLDTDELDDLGDIAYNHWYYHRTKKYYVPGFPVGSETDGNFGMLGEHMFRAYNKNIETNADIELTFYENPFETNADGSIKEATDANGNSYYVRRGWQPAELAFASYDSKDVYFTNFYGGGSCGTMSNNHLMSWDYTDNKAIDETVTGTEGHKIEEYGAVYRYTLPEGVTIYDKVVGGSKTAVTKFKQYNSTYTDFLDETTNPGYTFEGGMVTHSSFSYFLLIYCDQKGKWDHTVSPDIYLNQGYQTTYKDSYTFKDGSVTIYPKYYDSSNKAFPNAANLDHDRYAIATVKDASGNFVAYCGEREARVDQTVLKMSLRCQFDPQEGEHEADPDWTAESFDDTHFIHYGGVIYGGCFESGVTDGDVILNVSSNTIGEHLSARDQETFEQISSLEHNLGRVFGGGYGSESRVDGDTYVNLLRNFVGMNVFGGGCRGTVAGTTHVNYTGHETNSYVFGAIYGGGLYGSVGVDMRQDYDHATAKATDVRLFSGNVDKVYGGACLGDLYGRANVELCDQASESIDHLDYELLLKLEDVDDWCGARLIAGTVFGGNDISGNIYTQELPEGHDNYDPLAAYSTYVKVYEVQGDPNGPSGQSASTKDTTDPSASPAKDPVNPGKSSPGAVNGYNGFPLIGNLYGGSNGNYGEHENSKAYTDGTFRMATGINNAILKVELSGDPGGLYSAFDVPHVDHAYLDIQGGTIINVYGGGDKSTINESTTLSVNYAADTDIMDARAGFETPSDPDVIDPLIRIWNTFHLSDDEQIEEVTSTSIYDATTNNTIFKYHIFRIFGGNDNADMDIQPTWKLTSGHLGSVYSGGNFGRMTHFEYLYDAADVEKENPIGAKGLSLVIDSKDIHADAVFGGGRVGDIEPAIPEGEDPLSASSQVGSDFYGATLEIHEGVIDHVYGGNDVSGNVEYGSRVKITGAISGDVYCAGNGNYRYQYDPSLSPTTNKIEEVYDTQYGGRYFILPRRSETEYGGESPTDEQKLLAINAYRPNVERAYLTIEGKADETDPTTGDVISNKAFVYGNVYCGGNSSTINSSDVDSETNDIRFEIGDYVVLNGVFMGSNGESLVDPTMIEVTERLNDLNIGTTDATLLDAYMLAVDTYSLPKDFNLKTDLKEAYIGDFYVGGNSGSMLTSKTISLTFPYNLVIYNRIVGGSNNANVTYKDATHIGGLTSELSTEKDSEGNLLYSDKVFLQVRSQFEPMKILYPVNGDYRQIALVPDLIVEQDPTATHGHTIYFSEGKCSVFGGCYNSGRTVGNIHIDLYSDLVKEYSEQNLIDNVNALNRYYGFNIDPSTVGSSDFMTKERIIRHRQTAAPLLRLDWWWIRCRHRGERQHQAPHAPRPAPPRLLDQGHGWQLCEAERRREPIGGYRVWWLAAWSRGGQHRDCRARRHGA